MLAVKLQSTDLINVHQYEKKENYKVLYKKIYTTDEDTTDEETKTDN